ncbi:MAG: hypothetical protein ACJ8AK_03650 [Gemmatimonadaceae bacterium]
MIKLRPKTVRDAVGPFAGAVLLTLWAFFIFDANWLERIILAIIFGFFAQAIGLIAYFTASYFSAWLMGEKLDTKSIDIYDHRVAGALLLAAFVYVLGQHWRSSARDSIARCVREETRVSIRAVHQRG